MKFSFLLVVLFCCIRLNAQKISGKIIDSTNNTPLEFATVRVKKESKILKTELTDSSGNYSVTGSGPGKYELEFSFINYRKLSFSAFLKSDTNIDVSLVPLSGQMKEVILTAQKPLLERKNDRLIFNVANNVNAIGLDALELLAKTPQIRVDGIAISMIGKSTVQVMVNDRLLQMTPEALAAYLKALPAESIESIEVISNPPAIYSAEGSSGLINIVLKRNREPGYTGTATLLAVSPTSPAAAPGINLNYNKNNVRYYASLNTADGYHDPNYSTTIYYPQLTQAGATSEIERSQYAGGQIGFEADVSKASILGASLNLFYSYPYQTNSILTSFINTQSKGIDSVSVQNNEDKVSYYAKSSNIHYVNYLDTLHKKRIVIDADWYADGFDFPNKIQSILYGADGSTPLTHGATQTISNNMLSSDIYSLNGVAFLPGKKYDLYFGGKINFIKSGNNVNLNITNTDQNIQEINTSNSFSFTENTQALFINYKRDFAKKWSFQSGLRGENTQTRGIGTYINADSINKNSYLKIFPTEYLTYNLNAKNTLSFNYGRRINRPSFNSFNPYPQYSSQYVYFEGNPYLLPSVSNNFELAESHGNLYLSIQYSFSNKSVGNIGTADSVTDITVSKPYNFLSTRAFVVSSYYTFTQIKWLRSSDEFDVFYNKDISSSNLTPTISSWAANFRSDNSFFFNKSKTIIGGFYFYYQLPEIIGINKFKSYHYFDVTAKYLLLKNKLQLALKLSDIFHTLNIPFSNTVNNIVTSNVVNNDSRRLSLSIRYTFGNTKLKKAEAHSEDSNSKRAN